MVPAEYPSSTFDVPCPTDPREAWALAPLIAGAPSYRTGRWIGGRFQYPRPRVSPPITPALPSRPAAVLLHGADGSVATLCLDLDTSKALSEVVDNDARQLGKLLDECGLRYVADVSPSGGRHLYVPLAERLPSAEARELVEALSLRAPSLDPSPHQNITDGCIRVPGSAHKTGGHQQLTTPLSSAYDILKRRNPARALNALRQALAPELHRARRLKDRTARQQITRELGDDTAAPARAGRQSALQLIARTGVYDTAAYPSASEARMAVLTHFAACGWTEKQVHRELAGQLRGLAALYGTPAKQQRLFIPEWHKAVKWIQNTHPSPDRKSTTRINDTSLPKPTGGAIPRSPAAVHQLVNDLENVLYSVLDLRLMKLGRQGLSLRLLFRAILGYMRTMETDVLDVGCRTFAAALGKHHGTVSRLLPVLVEASDGILMKTTDARGRAADVYLIRLPEHFEQLARGLSWRQGKIHAVRPVFRVLGDVAALVYESIERGRLSPTTADITRVTGISRTAVEKALSSLVEHQMIQRCDGRWRVCPATNLISLARRLGALDEAAEQITRHRRQRAAWHAWLDRHLLPALADYEVDSGTDQYWFPPAEDDTEFQQTLWQAA